jgi:hypothetical protein
MRHEKCFCFSLAIALARLESLIDFPILRLKFHMRRERGRSKNCKCMCQKPKKSAVIGRHRLKLFRRFRRQILGGQKKEVQLSLIRFYLLRNFRRKLVPLIHVFFTLESVLLYNCIIAPIYMQQYLHTTSWHLVHVSNFLRLEADDESH